MSCATTSEATLPCPAGDQRENAPSHRQFMKRISARALAALLAFATVATLPLHAQATPLLGKWTIEYARGVRMENGEQTPIMGTGTLTITQDADSLVGTIDGSARPDGSMAPATKLTGRIARGSAVLVSTSKAKMNINGDVTDIDVVVTWTLQATGDALSGTMQRAMNAAIPMPDTPPSPVKGTRLKS